MSYKTKIITLISKKAFLIHIMRQSQEKSLIFDAPNDAGIDAQELKFYESLIARFREGSAESLLNKRAAIAKEDPTEELIELHLEIQEHEKQFKELVEIASYMLKKNKEMDELVGGIRTSYDGQGNRRLVRGGDPSKVNEDVERQNLQVQVREQ